MLIELARQRSGLSQQAMSIELNIHRSRLTKLKSGVCALTPTEGYYFAMRAGLPYEETMAELEVARDPANAAIWKLTSADAGRRNDPA